METPPSKVAHNRPRFFFQAAQTAQKAPYFRTGYLDLGKHCLTFAQICLIKYVDKTVMQGISVESML